MKISIITLFPEVFPPILNSSILGRAQKKGLIQIELINLRAFGEGPHQTVDDKPFGGGVGMILKPEVLARALKSVVNPQTLSKTSKFKIAHRSKGAKNLKLKIILMSPAGTPLSQAKARELSKIVHLILVCGHYEGVDQRFIDKYIDEEVSIGDYILTGGELPALVIVDSITRLIPKVLEKEDATINESFENNLLEYPHYTRPEKFEGLKVPEVLISGHHQKIKEWRKEKSLEKTKKIRPDLLKWV